MEVKASTSKITYRETLPLDVRRRYDEKTTGIAVDPYELGKEDFSSDRLKWPDVEYVDILYFLVFQQSAYTKEQFKNYKSTEAYGLFQDGWIQEILHKEIKDKHLLRAKVTHSMRIREKPLIAWVIATSDGSIESAHCTCMAGLGECCSHIGAMLFALETSTRMRRETTVTDVPAYWMFPNRAQLDTPYKRIRDMDLQSAAKKRKLSNSVMTVDNSVPEQNIPSPTKREKDMFFAELSKALPNSAILSLTPGYCEKFKPKSLDVQWPIDLSTLYESENVELSHSELIKKGEETDISVTVEQAAFVEAHTKEQSKSPFWSKCRSGRVTASNFHAVCRTTTEKPAKSLLKKLCYVQQEKTLFKSAATEWGKKNETTARKTYVGHMQTMHTNFVCKESGLMLNAEYPQFGASPDGVTSCTCCGDGLLEVKCPFTIKDYSQIVMPWLQQDAPDQPLQLDHNHSYYYQVQMQLFMSNRKFCDFFVWNPQAFHIQRIEPDYLMWEEMSAKALRFHSQVVMPELLAKFFTHALTDIVLPVVNSSTASTTKYCICNGGDDGRKMLNCDNENCPRQWYHMECLKLKRVPKGNWRCKQCR